MRTSHLGLALFFAELENLLASPEDSDSTVIVIGVGPSGNYSLSRVPHSEIRATSNGVEQYEELCKSFSPEDVFWECRSLVCSKNLVEASIVVI